MEGSVTLKSAVRTYQFQTLCHKSKCDFFFWPLAFYRYGVTSLYFLAKNFKTQKNFETFVFQAKNLQLAYYFTFVQKSAGKPLQQKVKLLQMFQPITAMNNSKQFSD